MYEPAPVPERIEDIPAYIDLELKKIAQAFLSGDFNTIRLQTLNSAPARPRDGDLIRADGTHYDPGSGEGVYERKAGAWSKL